MRYLIILIIVFGLNGLIYGHDGVIGHDSVIADDKSVGSESVFGRVPELLDESEFYPTQLDLEIAGYEMADRMEELEERIEDMEAEMRMDDE